MTSIKIEMNHLSKGYNDVDKPIIKDLNMEIKEGEVQQIGTPEQIYRKPLGRNSKTTRGDG
ncbi:hypothetical protein MHB42_16045 [Lysinibacillus sp. FSL K6-0232]|uniref:hypothetical protein n=1 Tax=unclassified Lysinibacillus TaxID=2636778 RepID=UPI0030F9A5DF